MEQVLARRREVLGPDHPDTLTSLNNLAVACQAMCQMDRAVPLIEDALLPKRKKLGPEHPDSLDSLYNLACAYHRVNREADAAAVFEELFHHEQSRYAPNHWRPAVTQFILGATRLNESKFAGAERALLAAEPVLAAGPAEAVAKHGQCVRALIRLYESWDRAEPGKGYGARAARW